MLNLDNPKWKELESGYKTPYDPTPALNDLENGKNVAESWSELWNALQHQGDLGTASYAAVPYLTKIQKERKNFDWNFYALVSVIEIERYRKTNRPVPNWLEKPYQEAWNAIIELGLEELQKTSDQLTARAALGAVAIGKGLRDYGAMITISDDSEIEEYLDEHFGWTENYR